MFTGKKKAAAQAQAQESLEHAQAQTTALQKDVESQNARIQKQQAFLDKLGRRQDAVLDRFEQEVKRLETINAQAASAVHNLNTAKVELKEQVTAQFQQQLVKATRDMEGKLSADLSLVDELSGRLGDFTRELKSSAAVIHQFQDLAKTIEDADFQLKEHAKALENADAEKVKLLKRIDELESMIAKFKRSKQRSPRF